eukprot:UN01437
MCNASASKWNAIFSMRNDGRCRIPITDDIDQCVTNPRSANGGWHIYLVQCPTIFAPTNTPSKDPSRFPTLDPTFQPTSNPSFAPTKTYSPTIGPTFNPKINPTLSPTLCPTLFPTLEPTMNPTCVDQAPEPLCEQCMCIFQDRITGSITPVSTYSNLR